MEEKAPVVAATLTMTAADFRAGGYLHEVNRLILHPLGLAMFADDKNDALGIFDVRHDPEGVAFGEDLLSSDKATAVAKMLEERGHARIQALGYVIQPLPPEVTQLKVSILERQTIQIGGPEDLDDGEELELTMHGDGRLEWEPKE